MAAFVTNFRRTNSRNTKWHPIRPKGGKSPGAVIPVPAVFVHRSAHADFPPGERPVTVCWDSSAIAAAAGKGVVPEAGAAFAAVSRLQEVPVRGGDDEGNGIVGNVVVHSAIVLRAAMCRAVF